MESSFVDEGGEKQGDQEVDGNTTDECLEESCYQMKESLFQGD